MILARIVGIPVEETALTFTPVEVTLVVGARLSGAQWLRKLRRGARASCGR
jgi:hypothetical protein